MNFQNLLLLFKIMYYYGFCLFFIPQMEKRVRMKPAKAQKPIFYYYGFRQKGWFCFLHKFITLNSFSI